jgi:hypothetical protein
MSRYCVDLNYCLACGHEVGLLSNKDCECYCHDLKEWTDGAEFVHKIDKEGNEIITHIDENGKKVTSKVSKAQREKIGSVFDGYDLSMDTPKNKTTRVYIVEYGKDSGNSSIHGVYLSMSKAKKATYLYKEEKWDDYGESDYGELQIWDAGNNKLLRIYFYRDNKWEQWVGGDTIEVKDEEIK